ncbi:hypothetical protein Tco_0087074, partial [Tanacetum coccineum]
MVGTTREAEDGDDMMMMIVVWLSWGSSRMEGEGRLWWRWWGGDGAVAEGWQRRLRRV